MPQSQQDFEGFNIDEFTTSALVKVVDNLKIAQTFFLDRFFSSAIYTETEYMSIDIDVGKRRMSPFVSPLEEGVLVESRRVETQTFKPPSIKDIRIPSLTRPLRRVIGERIAGDSSLNSGQRRFLANIAWEFKDQRDNLKRRMEWMATQSMLNGYSVLTGKGYPQTLIDFNRDASLKIVLAGKNMWDDPDSIADRTKDIRNAAVQVLKKSGAQITDLIFTNAAYDAFLRDDKLNQLLMPAAIRNDNDFNFKLGPYAVPGVMFMGIWGGFNLWLYNDWYVNDADEEKPMLPDGVIIGTSNQLDGIRMHGMIMDAAVGYKSAPFIPSMWVERRSGRLNQMLQSSPLPVPSRINATFVMRVAKGKEND